MLRILFILFCLPLLTGVNGQNLNTTLRAKMTFPNQTLANVSGYTARDGKEYALLGASKGMIIVDISNPDTPRQIVQIPGPDNLWKEIKTYSHYAYVVSEGGSGIQVINLKDLPATNLPRHYYRGDGAINNQLSNIHALHIDVKKGFLYAWGGALFGGGAKVFDLKPDPYNPVYVGRYTQLGYIHDGYVENDTMYAAHISSGQFSIVNMANKSAPELIATQPTPGSETHNTWLSQDHKTLFTTDETPNSFLTAYDISNPLDITQLDKIQSNPGSNSVVHNTHILGNFAVTSWYKDGITIVDVGRPTNLVQVGNYDTYSETGSGYDGCWGVYPFFPSGTLVATNINAPGTGNGEMFLITPSYHRACYLEGSVKNAISGTALNNVKIEVLGTNPLTTFFTPTNGLYQTGQIATGYFTIRYTKSGYQTFETTALFAPGEVVSLDVRLFPTDNLTITGTVLQQNDLQPVEGAAVVMNGVGGFSSATTTDVEGKFSFDFVNPGIYTFLASASNMQYGILSGKAITTSSDFTILLSDRFRKPEGNSDTFSPDGQLMTAATPFSGTTILRYQAVPSASRLSLFNEAGQTLFSCELSDGSGQILLGENLPKGIYFTRLEQDGQWLQTLKLLKTE